jgi:hypothetical protein
MRSATTGYPVGSGHIGDQMASSRGIDDERAGRHVLLGTLFVQHVRMLASVR